ncbi:MAG: AfsR/SARP family transcriptional regulator, partial [Streptosporangiaceae bacterium]
AGAVSDRRGAAGGLTALLAGIAVTGLPVLLYRLGGSPLAGRVPAAARLGHAVLRRDNASVMLAVVRDVSWIAWALFTLAVLAEGQAVLRHRTPPQLWLGGTLLASPGPVPAGVPVISQAAPGLARTRHRHRQTRRLGRRIPGLTGVEVAAAGQHRAAAGAGQRRDAAAQESVTALRGVLSELAVGLTATPQPFPEIIALLIQPDSLEVLLASPAAEPPPLPFAVVGGRQGKAWRMWLDGERPGLSAGAGDLLPGLLTIGTADNGYLLADLEHLRVTTVDGPASLTAAMLRNAAAELAARQLAGGYDLILVGFPELAVSGSRDTCCDTLDAGLDLLAARADTLRRRLGRSPLADIRRHRLAQSADEEWALTLLVSSVPPTDDQLGLLGDLAAGPGGIAALVPGGAELASGGRPGAVVSLSAGPSGHETVAARISPLQIEVCPQALGAADYEALNSLFAIAAEAGDNGLAASPDDGWIWPSGLADTTEWADDTGHAEDGYLATLDGWAAGDDWSTEPGTAGTDWADPSFAGTADLGWADPGSADLSAGAFASGWPVASTEDDQSSWAGQSASAGLPGQLAAWLRQPPPARTAPVTDSCSTDPGSTERGNTDQGAAGAAAGPHPDPPQPDRVESGPHEEARGAPASASPGRDPDRGPDRDDVQASLRIGVLGTFTINGQPAALVPAQSELVMALAINGASGLSNQQLCYLLGADPDHPKPSGSLRQLILRTRRQLGRAPDRREWLQHLGGGRYALHPAARFDWHEFEALTTDGMRSREAPLLRSALSLIRGRPFTDCDYWWLELALPETVRAQIVDAAEVLAGLELAAGDPAAAARAARIGLAGDDGAEQLWRALMRAEHAAGNQSGVREVWRRCLEAISEIAPDGAPHPATAALHRELLGKFPAHPGASG